MTAWRRIRRRGAGKGPGLGLKAVSKETTLSRALHGEAARHAADAVKAGKSNVFTIIGAVFATGAGFGYINLFNALTGDAEPTDVRGPIVALESYSGRWLGVRRLATVRHGGRNVQLSLNASEFAGLKVGDRYGREMRLGGLGYYYRWRVAYWK